MTNEEFRTIILGMDDRIFAQFASDFGGGLTREGYISHFVQHPEHEANLCHLLGRPTELDRQNEAALTQAASSLEANRLSQHANRHARNANLIAVISVLLSVASLVVSIVALVKSG